MTSEELLQRPRYRPLRLHRGVRAHSQTPARRLPPGRDKPRAPMHCGAAGRNAETELEATA